MYKDYASFGGVDGTRGGSYTTTTTTYSGKDPMLGDDDWGMLMDESRDQMGGSGGMAGGDGTMGGKDWSNEMAGGDRTYGGKDMNYEIHHDYDEYMSTQGGYGMPGYPGSGDGMPGFPIDDDRCDEALEDLRDMYWPAKKDMWANSLKMKKMVDAVWSGAENSGTQLGGRKNEDFLKWLAWQDHAGMTMCDALLPDINVQACNNPEIDDDLWGTWTNGFESPMALQDFLKDMYYWRANNYLCIMAMVGMMPPPDLSMCPKRKQQWGSRMWGLIMQSQSLGLEVMNAGPFLESIPAYFDQWAPQN